MKQQQQIKYNRKRSNNNRLNTTGKEAAIRIDKIQQEKKQQQEQMKYNRYLTSNKTTGKGAPEQEEIKKKPANKKQNQTGADATQ